MSLTVNYLPATEDAERRAEFFLHFLDKGNDIFSLTEVGATCILYSENSGLSL